MRYGRQRWKLKGRIEVNSRQSWDGDEMVFMPLITDLINIKVVLKTSKQWEYNGVDGKEERKN